MWRIVERFEDMVAVSDGKITYYVIVGPSVTDDNIDLVTKSFVESYGRTKPEVLTRAEFRPRHWPPAKCLATQPCGPACSCTA
jgi:hypothetical protein